MGHRRNVFVSDYEHAGERLVAICAACQRTAALSYREIAKRGRHMLTLVELARVLRCRNCGKKVADVKVVTPSMRPPSRRH